MSEESTIHPSASPSRRWSNRKVAVLLIGAGVFILLYNSGILGSAIWRAIWPLGLVALGLDLITEGRQRRRIGAGTLIAAAVFVPLLAGAQLMSRGREVVDAPEQPPQGITDRVSQIRSDIRLTAGSLRIDSFDGDKEPTGDVQDVVQIDSGEDLSQYFRRVGTTGVLNIDDGPMNARDLDLRFPHNVPLDLTVNMGAGDASLDFEDVRLEKLTLNVGAGSTEITLPESGTMNVNVSGGVGDIEIELPDDLTAQIEVDASLGDVDVDDRFQLRNGVYVTDDYNESAANQAVIKVKTGAGSIRIK